MGMTLNTNLTASIAHRNLMQSDADMTRSLSKLSSGQRVVSARDDAASMAIGSRLRADLASLRQIQINTTQAMSLMQVAEGAHARVYDMLVRLKALASQAGSASLSNTERSMLDTEYQSLLDEIDRVAAATTFNNVSLVNANYAQTVGGILATNSAIDVAFGGGNTNPVSFSMGSNAAGPSFSVSQSNGVLLSGSIGSNLLTNGALTSGTSIRLTNSASGNNTYFAVTFTNGVDFTSGNPTGAITLGTTTSSTTTQAFKVGIGSNPADNEIRFGLQGINTRALGLNTSNILSQQRSDAAYGAVGNAIDLLLTFRAEVGAAQSRLESTQQNIAVVVENLDAARSAYLDLDVAQEMSAFTNKQILQQAGVAMIAQANQLPQNLLRLFQQ